MTQTRAQRMKVLDSEYGVGIALRDNSKERQARERYTDDMLARENSEYTDRVLNAIMDFARGSQGMFDPNHRR